MPWGFLKKLWMSPLNKWLEMLHGLPKYSWPRQWTTDFILFFMGWGGGYINLLVLAAGVLATKTCYLPYTGGGWGQIKTTALIIYWHDVGIKLNKMKIQKRFAQ
jgi:hypothetical protein